MYHGVLQFMCKLVARDIIAVRPDREILQNLNDDDSDYEQVSYSSILRGDKSFICEDKRCR